MAGAKDYSPPHPNPLPPLGGAGKKKNLAGGWKTSNSQRIIILGEYP
jgi:hypothetical protein